MDLKGRKIILGSNSPRRRELMAGLNIDFIVDTGNSFSESYSPDTPYDEVPVFETFQGGSIKSRLPLLSGIPRSSRL